MANSRVMRRDTTGAVCTIDSSELGVGSDGPVRITNYKFLASYNWSKADDPTIFIPGCPPLWTPPRLPLQLSKDSHTAPIGQNLPRPPPHSFQPFFKSLLAMRPDFNMSPISLVSNRNNLRKLFDFVCNKASRSFRIDVDMIYDTMFLTRWEASYNQLVNGPGDSGFGHQFEQAFTTVDEDLVDSAGHHRIAQYNLGGMNCMVRFEADAYLDDSHPSTSEPLDRNSRVDGPATIESDIATSLQSLSLHSFGTEPELDAEENLKIVRKGYLVPPASVIELKSRSGKVSMASIIPQLWLSQTEHLFLGHHRQGLIQEPPKHYEMASYFKSWEIQNEQHLQKLLSLISTIREAVMGLDGRKGAIVYAHAQQPRKLRIYETTSHGMMELLDEEKKFWH